MINRYCILLLLFFCFGIKSFSQQLPSFFNWDLSQSRLPVTNLKFNTDSGLVQFAILSDRTGGMNPGVFEDAVEKTNLLQPQFIMSVGDLINGYSTDEQLINAQWKEFNDILEPLTVPFFYVPGNHDISNAWMQQEWERRYGKAYYYFIYKNTLFLSLNSQDDGDYGMKQAQVDYFLSIIKKFVTVKWTFVFMHQPLWAKSNTGFEKIEAALQDRDYTVFAGHTHNYMLSQRNNRKYFILATSGGGSGRRGEKFGEFDHITWVTLNHAEPKIVNIKLDGLVKEDVVDEAVKKAIRPLTSGSWLQVQPHRATTATPKEMNPAILVKNPGTTALSVKGSMPQSKLFNIQPASIDVEVAPGAEQKINYTITGTAAHPLNVATLDPIEIELQGSYIINNNNYTLPAKKRLLLDWPYTATKLIKPITISDKLDSATYINVKHPEQVDEDWDWQGTDDAGIRFGVAYDKTSVYISSIINDDHFVFQQTEHRDKVVLYLEDQLGKALRVSILPDKNKSVTTVTDLEGHPQKLELECNTRVLNNQLQMLLKLPLKNVLKADGTIRINIAYADQDDAKSIECATLYWKPLWKTGTDYDKSGTFLIK